MNSYKQYDQPDLIVSTDLDGTLLDHHSYSWQAAVPAIELLNARNMPVIFNTSKTLGEALALQSKMGVVAPVIIENGSAIAFPPGICQHLVDDDVEYPVIEIDEVKLVVFGCQRTAIHSFIEALRESMGSVLEGYGDWSLTKIMSETGLSQADAELSANKLFSEPFLWLGNDEEFKQFELLARRSKLAVLKGGRFLHLQGDTDKAKPLLWLRNQYSEYSNKQLDAREQSGSASCVLPKIIALGDNANDVAMLNAADYPVCVKSPVSNFPAIEKNMNAIFTEEFGPEGWKSAIFKLVS